MRQEEAGSRLDTATVVSLAAMALGIFIAGFLTDTFWRWVFFVNVPIAILAMIIIRRNVAESEAGLG